MEYECEHSYKYWYQNWEVVPYKYPDVQIVVHPGNQKLLMQADIIDWFASFFRFLDQFFFMLGHFWTDFVNFGQVWHFWTLRYKALPRDYLQLSIPIPKDTFNDTRRQTWEKIQTSRRCLRKFFKIEEICCPYYHVFRPFIELLAVEISSNKISTNLVGGWVGVWVGRGCWKWN